ncbi:MgtC/SapB family protein [Bosea sp. BK604]|uniref:MgtC/SapB family protein n=1 Tax=Bosea sp. BK604 TaxID=2512180 RepID=UPI00104FD1C0|nr:MgtC/SapB family protein [Bosea sp. BK604]
MNDLMFELDLILKLLAGLLAGVAIGWERTLKHKSAGLRTFALVGLGTAAATAVFTDPFHPDAASRVMQGILTGIGFLGAGVIIRREQDGMPHGLTTAAAIWVTAALGCSAGMGHWRVTLTATVLALLLLLINHSVERWIQGKEARKRHTLGGSEPRSKTGTDSDDPAGS